MTRRTHGKKRPPAPSPDASAMRSPEVTAGGKLKSTQLRTVPFAPRSPAQVTAKALLAAHSLVFLSGPAGTAKTTLAAAQAVDDLRSGRARRLVLTRANVEAAEDSIGSLPGSAREKMEIWCRAMLDSLALFLGKVQVKAMLDQELIELMPLGLVRGQSINDATVIVDEIQNMTPNQLKLMVTRIGENCRMLLTCDPGQCDLPHWKPSACEDLARFEYKPDIAFVDFTMADVTRSAICRTVLGCYS